ncbi:MAG TPA: ferric reductase-like transmembrane domain-containing protein [Candidatus Binatus sp.]|nr:ferric reductase-like transmembrane domain-containing protein [Candidatus Binatus sp.]
MTILDLCAYLGLAAVGTATLNLLLGLLIALRYSPLRLWPHRHINIFRLHNWTAYIVLLLILLHPAALLLRASTHFGWRDVLLPIDSPAQPAINTVGAAGLYGLLIVIVTSFFRLRMARPLWKKLHLLVFPAFVLMFIHSMFTDPLLSNGKVDLLDGGKIFVAICFAIALAASALRVGLRRRGFRPRSSGLAHP